MTNVRDTIALEAEIRELKERLLSFNKLSQDMFKLMIEFKDLSHIAEQKLEKIEAEFKELSHIAEQKIEAIMKGELQEDGR